VARQSIFTPAKRKIAARQLSIAPASRKIAAQQPGIAPASWKIMARQSVDRAGLLENCGTAICGSRQPLENLRHGNRVSRRPLGKSRHGNQWIAPAYWKIAARQLVDRAGHLKFCGGGLATISKGRDGLRKQRIRIEHGAPLKREALGRIMT
jgi:hypothetical protein